MKIFKTLGNKNIQSINKINKSPLLNFNLQKNFITFTKNINSNNNINNNINNINKNFIFSSKKFFADTPQKKDQSKDSKDLKNQEEETSSTKVSSKLLCELIGCKHYESNEEIKLENETVVNVYDESDKFLGKQTFEEAYSFAREYGKDIILRNGKVSPPVVKVMRYKIELVKRLMKKLGKTVESEKKENLKYMTLSEKISENDYNNKRLKIKELLAHFSYIRVVIPCDINNNEEVLKITNILNTLTNDLSDFCKVKSGPIRQKQKKEKQISVDAKITDPMKLHEKQEREIKEAFELSKIKEVNSDADLDFISSIYIDYESLLLDSAGINYEALLENVNLENLLKGITKTNILTKVKFCLKLIQKFSLKISPYNILLKNFPLFFINNSLLEKFNNLIILI